MNDDKTIIELMKKNINNLKKGSLRFWGEWFGRPMDNYHIITCVDFKSEEDVLVFTFNEGETLTVWNPEGIKSDSIELYIKNSIKVKWEWFSYGKPKIQENSYYILYEKQGSSIVALSGRGTMEYVAKKTINGSGQYAIEIC